MSGRVLRHFSVQVLAAIVAVSVLGQDRPAQTEGRERTFPQSKAAVEKCLQSLKSAMAGHLPVLDGFAASGDHPLDRYQRAYYQTAVNVSSTVSGETLVRVTAKVTAWYADPVPSRSGYQLLKSNGRLEADLLDRLADQLATGTSDAAAKQPGEKPEQAQSPAADRPLVSASVPKSAAPAGTFSSSVTQALPSADRPKSSNPKASDGDPNGLKAEAASLEEILKNQAHPKNLVAVKKAGTAVVATPSLSAKTLFLASPHDEFEILEFTPDWVHVRISGLSRGWIWRNNVEMPENIPDNDTASGAAPALSPTELFRVSREEVAPFPGDWSPLRGKNVKIVSVQKTDETAKDEGLPLRLAFAKALLDKNYSELAGKTPELAGIVLIFDSADGGMIAATLSTLQQWKAGTLSDAALWHQCFFDPPETIGSTGTQ
jgi:hypothetical protein